MSLFRFGLFELDPDARELRHQGKRIHLAEKPFELLVVLVERQGQIVTREEVRARLWPNVFVNFDGNLYVILSTLRKALGDNSGQSHIETVPRRGYRFVVPVELVHPAATRLGQPPFEAPSVPARRRWPGLSVAVYTAAVALLALALVDAPFHPLPRHNTVSADARKDYLRGRSLWNQRTQEDLEKSVELFRQAIAKDPNYALAHAGLADSYAVLATMCDKDRRAGMLTRAVEASTRATMLDPSLIQPYLIRAMYAWHQEFDAERATAEFQEAIRRKADDATARHWFGLFLVTRGHHQEALDQIHRAQELDPGAPALGVAEAQVQFMGRRYADAKVAAEQVLAAHPNFSSAERLFVHALLRMKYSGISLSETENKKLDHALSDNAPYFQFWKKLLAKDLAGARASWEKHIEETSGKSSPYVAAEGYALLGDRETALQYLREAWGLRDPNIFRVFVSPDFDFMRDDPRFQQLLRDAGFPAKVNERAEKKYPTR